MEALYPWLKFLHVAAVIVWVGGMLALVVLNARAGTTGDTAAQAAMGRLSDYFGRVAIGPAMIIVLIAGLGATGSAGFPFTSLWIVWGIVGFVVSGALMAAVTRTARELGEVRSGGTGGAVDASGLQSRLVTLNALNLLLLASIVWAMVFKPTL